MEADIQDLVRAGRTEGSTLEYKAVAYETNHNGSKEFLLDICSFANSVGGYLFIGVHERRENGNGTGAPDPDAPLGVEVTNHEQLLAAYEARVLDCIDERLLVESHAIPVANGRVVLAFRVPNSLSKPHRVRYNGHTAFPARRERQRYELTATEIKDLVMRATSRIELAESQLLEILDHSLFATASMNVAVAPIFTKNFALDFRRAQIADRLSRMDLTAEGRHVRSETFHTINGLTRTGPAQANVVLQHNGILRLAVPLPMNAYHNEPTFNPIVIDLYARGIALGCAQLYAETDLSAPMLFGISLQFPTQVTRWNQGLYDDPVRLDAGFKTYPSLILNSITENIDAQIRPLCDLVHQNLGEAFSPSFDEEGNWIRATTLR